MRTARTLRGVRLGAPLACSAVFGSLTAPSLGATLHVPSEYTTIQAGLDASVAGDVVLVAPGTYTDWESRDLGTGQLWTACAFLVDGVVLRSEGGPDVTILDISQAAGPQSSGINARLLSSPDTSVEGFTITANATTARRGIYLFGKLTVRDCHLVDLHVIGTSGAGIANAGGDLIVRDSHFENCQAVLGAAIYSANGRLEMHGCTVQACGEIAVLSRGNVGAPIESAWIENCTFEDCFKYSLGGTAALQIDGAHLDGATVRNCRFIRNVNFENSLSPAGLSVTGSGSRLVEGCVFLFNETSGRGGGLVAGTTFGEVVIQNNTFYGNRTAPHLDGAAAYFAGSVSPTFRNNIVAGSVGDGALGESQVDVDSSCNVFWDNENGVGDDFVVGPTDREIDPLFCDIVSEDFTVNAASPCLPPYSLGCGFIGAYPQGCGTVGVDRDSWGAIKAKYHESNGGAR